MACEPGRGVACGRKRGRLARAAFCVAVSLMAFCWSAVGWGDEDAALRARLVWGGDVPARVTGTITLDQGWFSDAAPLGTEPDEGAVFRVAPRRLTIQEASPRLLDGCDVTLHGGLGATLTVDLTITPRRPRVRPRPIPETSRLWDAETVAPTVETPSTPETESATAFRLQYAVTLAELLSGSVGMPPGTDGWRILASRVPGDRFRMEVEGGTVRWAGETVRVLIRPHQARLAPRTTHRLTTRLIRLPDGQEITRQTADMTTDATGEPGPPVPIRLAIPEDRDAAYAVRASLTTDGLVGSLTSNTVLEREIHLVAVKRTPAPDGPTVMGSVVGGGRSVWQRLPPVDLSRPTFWEKVRRLQPWSSSHPAPVGDGFRPLDGVPEGIALDPKGWIAQQWPSVPAGRPCRLVVTTPPGRAQTLTISVADESRPQTPIRSWEIRAVPTPRTPTGPEPIETRLVIWPPGPRTVLVVGNPERDIVAAVLKLEVEVGPERLPTARLLSDLNPLSTESTRGSESSPARLNGSTVRASDEDWASGTPETTAEESASDRVARTETARLSLDDGIGPMGGGRPERPRGREVGPSGLRTGEPEPLVAALIPDGDFITRLDVMPITDAATGRLLTDWTTYLTAADRLVQRLRHGGFGGAVVHVAGEGSALYPSRLLMPSPRYDLSVFDSRGVDPERKDVLELLLRVFDREGLTLVPAVRWDEPLAPVTALIADESAATVRGTDWTTETTSLLRDRWDVLDREPTPPRTTRLIAPVSAQVGLEGPDRNDAGSEPPSASAGVGATRGSISPLQPNVAHTLRDLAGELADRGARHPSFGGVCVQIGPDSPLLLPTIDEELSGPAAGVRALLDRFQQDLGLILPRELEPQVTAARTTHRRLLADWRATRMSAFWRSLAERVRAGRPSVRLILAPDGLDVATRTADAVRPALVAAADPTDVLIEAGLSAGELTRLPGVVLLCPRRAIVSRHVPDDASAMGLNESPAVAAILASGPGRGVLLLGGQSRSTFRPPPMADRVTSLLPPGRSRAGSGASPARPAGGGSVSDGEPSGRTDSHAIPVTSPVRLVDPSGQALAVLAEAVSAAACDVIVEELDGPIAGLDERLVATHLIWRHLPHRSERARPPVAGTDPVPVDVFVQARPQGAIVRCVSRSPWPVHLALAGRMPATATLDSATRVLPPVYRRGEAFRLDITLGPWETVAFSGEGLVADQVAWQGRWSDTAAAAKAVVATALDQVRSLASQLDDENGVLPLLSGDSVLLTTWEPVLVSRRRDLALTTEEGLLPAVPSASPGPSTGSVTIKRGDTATEMIARLMPVEGGPAAIRSPKLASPATGMVAFRVDLRAGPAGPPPEVRLVVEMDGPGGSIRREARLGPTSGTPITRDAWRRYFFRAVDLPTSREATVRLSVETLGAGDLLVRSPQADGFHLRPVEQQELLKRRVLAEYHLGQGHLAEAAAFVDSYWVRLLRDELPGGERTLTGPRRLMPRGSDESPSVSSAANAGLAGSNAGNGAATPRRPALVGGSIGLGAGSLGRLPAKQPETVASAPSEFPDGADPPERSPDDETPPAKAAGFWSRRWWPF